MWRENNAAALIITSSHCTWQPACEVEPTGRDHSVTECYWDYTILSDYFLCLVYSLDKCPDYFWSY